MVTSPGAVFGAAVDCTQKVSPEAVSIHWSWSCWPATGVRATARSQSFPTANTPEGGATPGRETSGAPDGAPVAPATPVPDALRYAITVSDPSKPERSGVAV